MKYFLFYSCKNPVLNESLARHRKVKGSEHDAKAEVLPQTDSSLLIGIRQPWGETQSQNVYPHSLVLHPKYSGREPTHVL